MGEPGTKIILTILTKVAETLARRQCGLGEVKLFQSAGDDQFSQGNTKYYR